MGTRLMGLDVGEKTIGVALTDPGRCIASPLTTIRRQDLKQDLNALQALMREHDVGEVVVGMPRSLSGERHFQAEKTQRFIDALEAAAQVPIHTWDERFSTAEANRTLLAGGVRRARRSQIIDQTAAAIILQSYLAGQNG